MMFRFSRLNRYIIANMYYKAQFDHTTRSPRWAVWCDCPDGGRRPIATDISEIDADRILAELPLLQRGEHSAERAVTARYRVPMYENGWTLFLDSQKLPGGTLMIRSKMLTMEMLDLLRMLKKAELPEGWTIE